MSTVHQGDCVLWLRGLPPGSADALITDPPYSSGGAFRSDRTGSTAVKYLGHGSEESASGLADFHGDNRDTRGQQGRPSSECEYAVWGSKGAMPMDGSPHPGHVSCVASRDRIHQTEKPVAMLRALVRVVPSGGLVLDPFAGSGSLGEACAQEDRRYMGCELSEHYAAAAGQRLSEVRPQLALLR